MSTLEAPVASGYLDFKAGDQGHVDIDPCMLSVCCDEDYIVFTESSKQREHTQEECIFDIYYRDVEQLLKAFPGLAQTYEVEKAHDPITRADLTCLTIPTITGLRKLRDGPLAQLQPPLDVRSVPYDEETPIIEYLDCMPRGFFGISRGADLYIHDVTNHAAGALALQAEPLRIFNVLVNDAAQLQAEGHPGARIYRVALGDAMDQYTGADNIISALKRSARKRSLLNKIDLRFTVGPKARTEGAQAAQLGTRALRLMRAEGGKAVLKDDEVAFRRHMLDFQECLNDEYLNAAAV